MEKKEFTEKIWDNFKKMIIYLIIIAISYYISPFVINSTGVAILMLVIISPVICFLTSILYGIKNGFSLAFPIWVGILFLPLYFFYYSPSGTGSELYIFLYAGISLFSIIIGSIFKKRIERQ